MTLILGKDFLRVPLIRIRLEEIVISVHVISDLDQYNFHAASDSIALENMAVKKKTRGMELQDIQRCFIARCYSVRTNTASHLRSFPIIYVSVSFIQCVIYLMSTLSKFIVKVITWLKTLAENRFHIIRSKVQITWYLRCFVAFFSSSNYQFIVVRKILYPTP